MTNPRAITLRDVPQVFDAARIQHLATVVKLPPGCDLDRFGESVRVAVHIYARAAATPTNNGQRREIEELHRHSAQKAYERLAQAIEAMTHPVRSELRCRQSRVADRMPEWRIPDPAELRDPATRKQAAQGFEALTCYGGYWAEGRKRPTGRRSRTFRPELYAPSASRGEPRRAAERDLVMWLQVAVAETAARVPLAARHGNPGPFARMVAEVLQLVGAAGPANATGIAVELINRLHRDGRQSASALDRLKSPTKASPRRGSRPLSAMFS